MAKLFKLLNINLRLFEGAAPAAAPTGGADAAATSESQAQPLPTHKGKTSGDKVVFGKPPEADKESPAAEDTQSQTKTLSEEERRKAYDEFIAQNKDIHTQVTQSLFDRRFKEVKATEEALAKQSPIIDTLMQRYGVSDISELSKAIDADNGFWEKAAEAEGMNVAQYKDFLQMRRENAQFRAQTAATQQQIQAQEQVTAWRAESEQVKTVYPDFDLQAEFNNPQFVAMLKSRVPMQHAYEVMHIDDIKNSVKSETAKQTEKAVVDNVKVRGVRPAENGVNSSTGVVYKSDVSKLSPKDRQEAIRQAARGVPITFR